MKTAFKKIEKIVEKEIKNGLTDHGMDHILRVFNLATMIAKKENADLEIVGLAALLHDVGQKKEMADKTKDHAIEGSKMTFKILSGLGYHQDVTQRVVDAVKTHRYRTSAQPQSLEAKIIFDADKLDGSGAIGIARGYMWCAEKKCQIHREYNLDDYIKENLEGGKISGRIIDKSKHTVFIDYEVKGKFLPQKLYTKTGRKIAKDRVRYYKSFLDRLKQEITGTK